MNKHCLCLILFVAVVQVSYAEEDPLFSADDATLGASDIDAPTVTHTPPANKLPNGDLSIDLTVTDNVGVKSVTLYYRQKGQDKYHSVSMLSEDAQHYYTLLPATQLNDKGLEYYIQAEDMAGNSLLHGYSFAPISIRFDQLSTIVENDVSKRELFGQAPAKTTPLLKNKWLWIGLGSVVLYQVTRPTPPPDDEQTRKTVVITGPVIE